MPSPNTMQDVDAYSDSGSTISLASCGSGGNEFSPRPPRDGSVRSKSVKGRRSRVSNKTHSPYASRQQPPKRREPTKPTAQNLWMSAMKNGTGALSTNNTGMDTWAGGRPAHASKRRPGSRTRNFSDVVDLTNGKSKSISRSATLSYSQPMSTGGGLALKPAEDYYDDIIELKKIINSLKEENNRVNTKLHRVEEENVMKDRRIEDLLNSRKQPEDLRRTLTDKRGDSSSIVTSLKQKLHAVERTVKDKEAELNKMKRDVKTTDVEELNIQSEVYYQEVQRLQLALLQMQQDRINDVYAEDNFPSSRARSPINSSQQKLQKDIEILKAENKSLKKEMISTVENQSERENKKTLNVDYADMTRGQLLQTIHELEMREDDSAHKSSVEKEKDEREERNKSKRKKSRDRKSSTSSAVSTAEDKEAELFEENEKQQKIIERLKDDRTHYRLVADDLRKQLTAKEVELEELQLLLSSSTTGAAPPSRKVGVTSTSSQYSPRKQSITAKERDEMMEREYEEFQQRHAAKVLQKQWRTYKGNKNELTPQQAEQDKAAKTLQREWRKHLNQRDAEFQIEAITDIQAAFRGHLARKERLDTFGDDVMDSDDAIVNVQSAFRGHLTRTKNREEPEDDQWSHGRSRDSLRNVQNELSDEDSDDDIVIGGRSSGTSAHRKTSPHSSDKSPFSAKRRSSFTGLLDASPPQPPPRTKLTTPQPARRTLKTPPSPTLRTTPPSPTPRKRTPPVNHTDNDDDDDSDDDVIIGGSPEARRKAPHANHAKSSHAQTEPVSSKSTKSATRTESSKDQLGLTKSINRQRTIEEAAEDSDDDVIVSSRKMPSSSHHVVSSRDRKSKPSRHEIIDSDEDEDDIVISTKSTTKSPLLRKSSTGRPNHDDDRKTRTRAPSKVKKSMYQNLEESGSDEEDEVVMSSKPGKRSSRSSSSKYSKNTASSAPKRPSVVDSLLSSKSSFRSSEDNRTTTKTLVQDDDDDDDDDMVISSFRKGSFKSRPSATKEKDSLASLWSDTKPKKKSSFGFSSFGDSLSSSKRRVDSNLDELF